MKKSISVIFILLAFLMTITSFFGFTKNTALAEENLSVKSKSAYLVDAATGSLIYAENENAKLPIASMCKIMTLLLSFEAVEEGLVSMEEEVGGEVRVIGEVTRVVAEESAIGGDGKFDLDKAQIISFDMTHNAYRVIGEKVGNAFSDGAALK